MSGVFISSVYYRWPRQYFEARPILLEIVILPTTAEYFYMNEIEMSEVKPIFSYCHDVAVVSVPAKCMHVKSNNRMIFMNTSGK